eukprot:Tamp_11380.p2 GENE.Tamp_11380~~Tamp_11380.p2  ORF type:complete len:171 (-),score=53.29 Tamp_11380:1412-1900(-)
MGVILSLGRRKGKKAAEEAAREHERKVEELCEMFPMLDKDTLVTVLDANEGDFEKTMEMFKPINPAAKEEHQKRPASRAGPDDRPAASAVHLEELISWASSSEVDKQYQAALSLADLAMSSDERMNILNSGAARHLIALLASDKYVYCFFFFFFFFFLFLLL